METGQDFLVLALNEPSKYRGYLARVSIVCQALVRVGIINGASQCLSPETLHSGRGTEYNPRVCTVMHVAIKEARVKCFENARQLFLLGDIRDV